MSCWHSILRVFSLLGFKYEPEQILPNEDRKEAIMREVGTSFGVASEKYNEKIKRFEKKQYETTRRILKILKDCGGVKNLKDPIQIHTLDNLMKARKLTAGYILMIQKSDASMFNNGAKLEMGSFMIQQNAMLEANVKKLKSCGITDTAKIEQSMLKMELMMDKIDATINAVNTNTHKNMEGEAIEIPEVDFKAFAAELQHLEDEAAQDEVKQAWENAGKPKQRRREDQHHARQEQEPAEYDDYEKAMWEV